MAKLTKLQRRILAVLEEAGEENFTALTNTVAQPHGTSDEIDIMGRAIIGLVNQGFVEVAQFRNKLSRHWVLSASEDVLRLLQDLKLSVDWSADKGLWVMQVSSLGVQIILTEAGEKKARQILTEDGWPERPLACYEE